ncbi:helix-turn-helix domain-containing protein [Bradyrhizobium erythrophlei]|uniref:helix-turn-helix domain-containing protein n=1 Tax=Bradyrhizobium erythrophlei TaxID=1437360 RepID=UPI0035EC2557
MRKRFRAGTELAALSGISLRSLQAGFRRFVGVSIAAYQRQNSLGAGARRSLARSGRFGGGHCLRWGFTNAGRFSRYVRAAYGILPTELIRGKP